MEKGFNIKKPGGTIKKTVLSLVAGIGLFAGNEAYSQGTGLKINSGDTMEIGKETKIEDNKGEKTKVLEVNNSKTLEIIDNKISFKESERIIIFRKSGNKWVWKGMGENLQEIDISKYQKAKYKIILKNEKESDILYFEKK